jgi:hypothetical protein
LIVVGRGDRISLIKIVPNRNMALLSPLPATDLEKNKINSFWERARVRAIVTSTSTFDEVESLTYSYPRAFPSIT